MKRYIKNILIMFKAVIFMLLLSAIKWYKVHEIIKIIKGSMIYTVQPLFEFEKWDTSCELILLLTLLFVYVCVYLYMFMYVIMYLYIYLL